jgi:chemotaxis signal transduction protein
MFTKPKVKEAKAKILVFPIGDLMFGAKLEAVLKVIPMPTVYKSGEKLIGVANFEEHEVLVIDLYQRVFNRPLTGAKGFLLILVSINALYGVTVGKLPILREVPLSDLHPLPANYRERDSLGIASHMIQLVEKELPQTVFLIDTELLLQITEGQPI